jgi:alkylated DNA repair protein alkB family protein 4
MDSNENNYKNNLCVCKGIRSCSKCETTFNCRLKQKTICETNDVKTFIYCNKCGDKAFSHQFSDHFLHSDLTSINSKDYILIDGLFLLEEVITEKEEKELIKKIDSIDWINSQSGRRKQDFGPKVNFKRQKLKYNEFFGLPQFDKQLLNKIKQQISNECLNDFIEVEVCHLEYNPENGSSIDPHFDDFWLWGERLVTVNLLSKTILTLILPQNSDTKVDEQIYVHLPQRSLVVLSGDSRYKYQHAIQRQHINARRIAITYRELTQQFLPKGSLYDSYGKEILIRANNELKF